MSAMTVNMTIKKFELNVYILMNCRALLFEWDVNKYAPFKYILLFIFILTESNHSEIKYPVSPVTEWCHIFNISKAKHFEIGSKLRAILFSYSIRKIAEKPKKKHFNSPPMMNRKLSTELIAVHAHTHTHISMELSMDGTPLLLWQFEWNKFQVFVNIICIG